MALRDYLNYPIREELRQYVLAHGQAIAILGIEELGDCPQETWYFDENSMAVDDSTTVIRPNDILETDPGRYILNMVQADWNATFNKPDLATVATSGSYDDLTDKITAGEGILMTGNELSVDDTKFMSVPDAETAIAAMQSDINSKTPEVRTITINGQTKDLSGNRSWEVGNVSTAGAYADPSWITSLDYSKVLNKPTIPSAQVNSDWNSVSGVSQILNKPVIPTNTNQLTNGAGYITGVTQSQITTALGLTPVSQSGARSAISVTTTGTGAASYNSGTGVLNIPTPPSVKEYVGSSTVSSAGNAIFYLTSDGTSTGTALFTTVTYANPFVNDSAVNYSYSWSYNGTTKALTVNVKAAVGINVSLIGLTLLGLPSNVANGTAVSVFVKGT